MDLWQQRLEASQALIGNWSGHQDFDSYWQRGSAVLDYAAIACPVYVVAGLLDTYVNPVGRMLAELPGPTKGLVGCWGHTYPDTASPNGVEWFSEELRWWRHWLRGEATGIMNEPQLWVFMPEAPPHKVLPAAVTGHWHPEAVWPPQSPAASCYYLDVQQLCAEKPAETARIRYQSLSAVGSSRPDWLNQPPGEQSQDDKLSVTFDSQRLSDPQQLLGYPRVKISLATQTPAAGIWVRLNEVLADGSSWPVTQFVGSLNRLLDITDPPALQTGVDYEFDLLLSFTAHTFQPGSRIRLALSAPPWPMTLPLSESMGFVFGLEGASLWLPSPTETSRTSEFPIVERTAAGVEPQRARWRSDDDGNLNCEHVPSEYRYRDRETATMLSASTRASSTWRAGGENIWRQESERRWQREGWDCAVMSGCDLHADAGTVTIEEWLEATQNDAVIFSRKHRSTILRRLI